MEKAVEEKSKIPWTGYFVVLLFSLSILTVIHNIKFLSGSPVLFEETFREKYMIHWPVVFTHGVTAMLALVTGPLQFLLLRFIKPKKLHKALGLIYVFAIFFAAPTGLIMGTMAHGGFISQLAFIILSILWFWTTFQALRFAIRKNIKAHKNWIIRSFALTFGAVVLRLELNTLQYLGFNFHTIYPYMAFASWIPCLMVSELIIHHGKITEFRGFVQSIASSLSGKRIHKA